MHTDRTLQALFTFFREKEEDVSLTLDQFLKNHVKFRFLEEEIRTSLEDEVLQNILD